MNLFLDILHVTSYELIPMNFQYNNKSILLQLSLYYFFNYNLKIIIFLTDHNFLHTNLRSV